MFRTVKCGLGAGCIAVLASRPAPRSMDRKAKGCWMQSAGGTETWPCIAIDQARCQEPVRNRNPAANADKRRYPGRICWAVKSQLAVVTGITE